VPPLDLGSVVWAEFPDPQGRNPKRRPAVVLTTAEDIAAGTPIVVVAVTTQLPRTLPPDYVRLPWSRPRHPRTGLSSPCAAVCTWLAVIQAENVLEVAGRVPDDKLEAIVEKVTKGPAQGQA
jgi:mRNA-degrading endonuclease toxin of MazEF toxin-antitoxin module